MARFRKLDGRWLAALIVLGYFSILILAHLLLHRPVYQLWQKIYRVPALPEKFTDLRDVVGGAEALHAGEDPWKRNIGVDTWGAGANAYDPDPLHRPFNYPRWWLYADYIGLNQQTLKGFGIGMGLLFFACAFFVLGRLTVTEGLLAGLFLVSTCVMFGVERGNIDLVIFSVLTLALAFRRLIPVHCLLISLAAILKIYPAFGLLTLVGQNWRKTLPWLVASAGLLFVYFILNLQELHRIAAVTPHVWNWSYGSSVAILALHELYLHAGRAPFDSKILAIGDLIMIGVMVVSVWKRPRFGSQINWPEWERELCSFRLGTGVYLGTFALGANFDYRILFLAFCLPLLFRLRRESNPAQPWATTALILTLLYANTFLLLGFSEYVLKEVLMWGIVFILTGLLSSTLLPDSIQFRGITLGKREIPGGQIQSNTDRLDGRGQAGKRRSGFAAR
jgi:hypothetical protein